MPDRPAAPAAVALVTGGGRGIGRELALGLARAGLAVGLLGRRPGPLEETAAACRALGGRALPVPADVTDERSVRAAVAGVRAALGPVDLAVSNAGQRERGPAAPWAADPADWWSVVQTNLRGPFLVAQAVLPEMLARGGGRLLHLGSGLGDRAEPSWSAYSVSKAGLRRLTDNLAAALRGTGVVVLEASPGLVRTDMTEQMWGPPEEQEWQPVTRIVDLAVAFAVGRLDGLHGRFVHAARDDLDRLAAESAAAQPPPDVA